MTTGKSGTFTEAVKDSLAATSRLENDDDLNL